MKPLRTLIEEESPLKAKQKEEELQKARKQLRDVIEQFPTLQSKAQEYWLKYALERPEIPESTELLRKYQRSDSHEL